jgi:hypothetical protein
MSSAWADGIGAIGLVIKLIADQMGEPVADVRKRVIAELNKPAVDDTDAIAGEIDAAMPDILK